MGESSLDDDARFDLVAAIKDTVANLPADFYRQMMSVCDEFCIPEENRTAALWWAHRLSHFENDRKAKLKTPMERREGLERVGKLANELMNALDSLDSDEVVRISSDFPSDCHEICGIKSPIFEGAAYLVLLAWTVERVLADDVAYPVKRGGRKPTMKHYAGMIEGLAGVAESAGITVARGGQFEKFCEAVFDAAGITAEAEGAVRTFVEQSKSAEKTSKKTERKKPAKKSTS